MISIKEITKKYGAQTVLDIPELEIREGETFGLVGNNGAGKTTMFRCILDLIQPNSGRILIRNEPVAGAIEWKNFTGSYLDDGFLIDFLTPEEYFDFIADIYTLSVGDITSFFSQFEEFFADEILGKRKLIRDFSSGNRQKIGIAGAMMPQPDLLVLDEPFNSLDPSTQIRLIKMLQSISQHQKTTMLISSHDLNHITEVCQRIVVLHEGKVVHDMQTNKDTLKVLHDYFSVNVL
jgi:ABC-2 type transport system ATP-binding protein